MDKKKGPTGFIVVLPGEVIEIPQDSDKSWLTLFYSLPRELAEKWKTKRVNEHGKFVYPLLNH